MLCSLITKHSILINYFIISPLHSTSYFSHAWFNGFSTHQTGPNDLKPAGGSRHCVGQRLVGLNQRIDANGKRKQCQVGLLEGGRRKKGGWVGGAHSLET